MKIRTLLVDSSFLLKRSYYGAKNIYTKVGHIGGLYSFLTTLRKLIKQYKINKVVLVWDGENGGIYRYNIDHAYKANRKDKSWNDKIQLTEAELKREKEKEESILKQRKRIQTYAEELFFRQIEVDQIEADDLIAAYCIDYNEKEDIYIYSKDRDFLQLLDLNITIIFPDIEEPITKDNFFFKFQYHYSNSLTMKIICGDSSDNIQGVQGIKEPTLLKHFPDLRSKYVSVKEIIKQTKIINEARFNEKKKPLIVLERLLNSVERFKINYKLINLKKPFLNDQAINELEQLKMPLSSEDRGSKNLIEYMKLDEFLSVFGGSFVNYVEPFYPVIMNENKLLQEYYDIKKKKIKIKPSPLPPSKK